MSIQDLSKGDIKVYFTDAVYKRGVKYFNEDRVRNLIFDPINTIWTATVKGFTSYDVKIEEDEFGFSSKCDCPAYESYWEPCKHIAAVMLKIQAQNIDYSTNNTFLTDYKNKKQEAEKRRQTEYKKLQEERVSKYEQQLTNEFIERISSLSYSSLENNRDKQLLKVDWFVNFHKSYYASSLFMNIEMKVGQKRTYVVRRIREFLQAINWHSQYPFTQNFTYDPTEQMFTTTDQAIINLLQEAVKYEEAYDQLQTSYYSKTNRQDDRGVSIPPLLADQFLNLLTNSSAQFTINGQVYSQIIMHHNEMPVSISLNKGKTSGFQLDLQQLQTINYLDLYGYVNQEQHFYKLLPDQQLLMKELTQLVKKANKHIIPIVEEQMEPFISQTIPIIEKAAQLNISEKVTNKIVKLPLQTKVYVDLTDGLLSVSVDFHYGEYKINPFQQVSQPKAGPIIMREVDKEQFIMDVVESSPLKLNVNKLYTEEEDEIFEFLYEHLPSLEGKADIFLTNTVKSVLLHERPAPMTNIEVNSSGNLLEIKFDIDGIDREQIQSILQSVVEKKRYYRLPDGAFVPLETAEFQTIQTIMQEF